MEPDGTVVALMALSDDMIEQLYVAPAWIGRGLGRRSWPSRRSGVRPGSTCTASPSTPTRAGSTSAAGFEPIAFGDGSHNEERQPDVRYAWRPMS